MDGDIAERSAVLLKGYTDPDPKNTVPPALLQKLVKEDAGVGAPLVKAVLEDYLASAPNGLKTLTTLADAGFRFVTNPALVSQFSGIKGGAMVGSDVGQNPSDASKFEVTGHFIYLNPRRADVWTSTAAGGSVLRNELTNALPIAEYQRLTGKKLPYANESLPNLVNLQQEVNGAVVEAQHDLLRKGTPIDVKSTLNEIGKRAEASNQLWLGKLGFKPAESGLESAVMYLGLTYGDQPEKNGGVSDDLQRKINDAGLKGAARPQDLTTAVKTSDTLTQLAVEARKIAVKAGYDPATFSGNLPAAQLAIRKYLESVKL